MQSPPNRTVVPDGQRELVIASEHATAGRDVGGPRRRHASRAVQLAQRNQRLERELAAARESRDAAIDAYTTLRRRIGARG